VPFKLLGILGEGGCGIVYLAEQERPIRRRVALKVIKPGMDSKQVIARFEAERQALALLDHPNIAHIYDAGTTAAGRPYFAMEYVEGVPITEHCDREKLDLRERLRLFLQVCSAVQHAHQKAIIHRDLKPSNILVTAHDDKPLIKVIDFGIAKALAQPLTEQTLYTEQGQLIGTPDYMSPEQAEMDARGVDTRSDIYSLGVVLYELLTGVLPFDPDALRAGGIDHIRAVLQDEEPRTPSTRLTGMGEETRKIATRRRTDGQALARSLRRELEWIPLKAMRKEASRRYQSVSELADDIEKYLRGAPLRAGPESAAYRAKKFVQRHSGAVAATAIIIVSLLIGLIVSTAMYLRAEKLRVIADDSRQTTQTAQVAEASQRQTAEKERDRAVKAEEEATRRLVDLYQEQGRRYMELGDFDRALVLLTEALKNDGNRLGSRLLVEECLRSHADPNLHVVTSLIPWRGEPLGQDFSFATSPDRKYIAFISRGSSTVRVFDTETAEQRIQLQTGEVSKLAFVPGNEYLLAKIEETESRHSIRVLDLNTGERVTSIRRANADIDKLMACPYGTLPPRNVIERSYNRILLSRDGNWFAFLDVDDSGDKPESWVVLWDFSNKHLDTSARYPFDSLLIGVVFRPASSYSHPSALIAIDCKQICHLWDVPQFTPSGEFYFAVVDGVFSGTRMIVQKPSGAGELLDRSVNRAIVTVPRVIAYGFSPDTARFITKTLPEPVLGTVDPNEGILADLGDTREGAPVVHLSGAPVENWHFSPDSRFLISEHTNGEIRVWLSESGRLIFVIPPEVDQEVADISPDSGWLATRDRKTGSTIGVWNLTTGEQFRPYTTDLSGRDIGAGWTIGEIDSVFCCSERPSGMLPRFNASGSALMSRQGLLPFRTDASSIAQIASLVTAHIDLRIENGRIRPASQEEIWLARLDYCRRAGAERSPEAVDCLLNLTSHAMGQDDLARASMFLQQYLTMPRVDNAKLAERGTDLAHKLSIAYFRQGDREERRGHCDAAIDNYKLALFLRNDDQKTLHRLAWVLATCPDQQLRNTAGAVTSAERACVLTNWRHWGYLNTYAVACAADGRFADAVAAQKKAIELLPPTEEARWAENLRTCLRLFESNRPYNWRHFCNLPDRNLLCWWTFDDLDGKSVRDRSGHGHTAELSGEVRRLTDDGHAVLQFYGAEGRVQCPDTPELNVRDALTVVAWVKYAPTEDEKEGKSQQVAGKGDSFVLSVALKAHTAAFACAGLNVPASAPRSRVIGKTPLNDGRWHQLAGVYDGQALSLYLDGKLDATVEASGSLIVCNQGITLSKGVWYLDTWRGLIRDARVYDRALSEEEVGELHDATKW
jgi:WD40 repeat protein/tRNA A-37 threonylcarbamoyl transferase component Bud32